MSKKIKITENELKGVVNSVLNEFFSRDDMDAMKSFGIKDPTDDDVINVEELKLTCKGFLQKCNEFLQSFNQFYGYIDGIEEDSENGIQAQKGVRDVMRSRNLFGARNLSDEFMEENINTLSSSLQKLKWELDETMGSIETLI